jgi:hypothetical protein
MKDSADFRERDIREVFGDNPKCSLCGKSAAEAHHCLKRGYNVGIRPNSVDREIMSSILGCATLCMKCHTRGDLHTPEIQRRLLLGTLARVASSPYEETEIDNNFRKKFKHRFVNTNF